MVDIAVPKKRGRPPKVDNSSVATAASSPSAGNEQTKKRGRPTKSKGRGRPPKAATAISYNTDIVQNEVESKQADKAKGRGRKRKEPGANEHNDDPTEMKQIKLEKSDKKAKTPGRPRKQQTSDQDKDIEPPISRSLGRPSTGAIKLHIATKVGAKVGRPKKNTFPAVVAPPSGSNGVGEPKKRGRPPSGKAPKAYIPSGKPRGRPKLVSNTNEISFVVKEDNKEEDDVIFSLDPDDSEELTTQIPIPKKRGRPPMSDKTKNASMNIN